MYKVLIVDDDKLARRGIISMVDWASCDMKVVGDVANGALALKFVEEHSVDLVVVDLSMPVLSGLDFIYECRKKCEEINYVILTFHESFEYVQKALRLGALDYLSKMQLEYEDCNLIFKRVSEQIKAIKKIDSNFNDTSGAEIGIFDELCRKITKCYWIYDEGEFEEIISIIDYDKFSRKQIHLIALKMLFSMDKEFGLTFSENEYLSFEPTIEQLVKIKKMIRTKIREQNDFSKIEFIIFNSVDYIGLNLTSDELNAEKVADSMNLSRSYFSTNFKKYTGSTTVTFIKKERVRLAKNILLQGKITISKLSNRVGYRDEKYFSKVFYEIEGIHCSEYKRHISNYEVK